MSPEALARLRKALSEADPRWHLAPDLRALLEAYDTAMKAGQTVVECADEMREEWAETEERLIAERDAARAEGVAAERARVVAWLRDRFEADDEMGDEGHLADCIERGEHQRGES